MLLLLNSDDLQYLYIVALCKAPVGECRADLREVSRGQNALFAHCNHCGQGSRSFPWSGPLECPLWDVTMPALFTCSLAMVVVMQRINRRWPLLGYYICHRRRKNGIVSCWLLAPITRWIRYGPPAGGPQSALHSLVWTGRLGNETEQKHMSVSHWQ